MTEHRLTPRQELIITLDAADKLADVANPMPPTVKLSQVRGLLDHARALALRVGEERRERKTPPGIVKDVEAFEKETAR